MKPGPWLLQNRPNSELDLTNPQLVRSDDGFYQDTIEYNYAYDPVSSSAFAENVRRVLWAWIAQEYRSN
ncbi:MAG: hypothetical protein U5L96_15420 [Owenweeksia sp.]|nr:hypothetical protein [Owenweeksia sp.]